MNAAFFVLDEIKGRAYGPFASAEEAAARAAGDKYLTTWVFWLEGEVEAREELCGVKAHALREEAPNGTST